MYYSVYNKDNEILGKENTPMFATMMNKQNKWQELWSNLYLLGNFVLSVCVNHSAVMVV